MSGEREHSPSGASEASGAEADSVADLVTSLLRTAWQRGFVAGIDASQLNNNEAAHLYVGLFHDPANCLNKDCVRARDASD